VTALNVSGPGQLDAQFKSLLPNGTEGTDLVKYKWDGEKLSRSEDASNSAEPATGDQALNQAATVEPSKNAAEDIVPTAEDFNRQGVAFAYARQYDLAISCFTKAIVLNAGQAELYNNRGTAFDGVGNFRRAIQDYDEAIKRNGNYPEAYFNRGNAFLPSWGTILGPLPITMKL
jgi:tetratricopeptide (TPR) repeat protein